MARIIESGQNARRTIKLSTEDILSVVREYQRIVSYNKSITEIRDILQNNVIFLPEDV